MQLHPAQPTTAMRFAVESVAAGFIGLDFKGEPGDLRSVARESLSPGERDYWDFANRMRVDDRVLVIVHHFPFALVTVSEEYNYISRPEPELGVWFRHFRRIDRSKTLYYADKVTDVRQWEQYRMADTISILLDSNGKSLQLMKNWLGSEPES